MYFLKCTPYGIQPDLVVMAKIVTDRTTACHYVWGENCDSWLLADTGGLSVKYEGMPPGTSEKLHYHNQAQQFFYIVKGSAVMYLDNEQISLSEHQGLLVHPGTRHFIQNLAEERLEFLVVSQPSTNNDRITLDR